MERKLASIQKIKNIRSIEKADRLEKANVEAFQVVVPKGVYKENDLVVFFEADSFLPVEDRFAFLLSSLKENEIMGKGYRIKVQKIRGEITHGLVMKLSDFPEINDGVVGLDVTDILNIKKWDMSKEEKITGKGVEKPWFIPTTDETRIQAEMELLNELYGRNYYISTKIDGMSVTMYVKDGEFGITSRKISIPEDKNNSIWKYAMKNNIKNKLTGLSEKTQMDYIIQGEFAGPKIQNNHLGLKDFKWFVFNVFAGKNDVDMKMLNLDEMVNITNILDVNTVPVELIGTDFNSTLEDLYKAASGNYTNGHPKEGIVIRPTEPIFSDKLQKELSFKVLNDEYWAKER